MRFGQVIEYNKGISVLQNSFRVENKVGRLVPDFFLFFKKALYEVKVKASDLQLSFNIFRQSSAWNTIKRLYKTLHFWSRDMLNIDFLEKGLGIVSLSHFAYDFSRKAFLMLYFINWLPLLLEILLSMGIGIFCEPGCDVIKFEISLIFLIKPFFLVTKKSKQKIKYLEN